MFAVVAVVVPFRFIVSTIRSFTYRVVSVADGFPVVPAVVVAISRGEVGLKPLNVAEESFIESVGP